MKARVSSWVLQVVAFPITLFMQNPIKKALSCCNSWKAYKCLEESVWKVRIEYDESVTIKTKEKKINNTLSLQ